MSLKNDASTDFEEFLFVDNAGVLNTIVSSLTSSLVSDSLHLHYLEQ